MKRTDGEWTRPLEIVGEEREAALAEAGQVLAAWGMVMPECDPLTLHFGLNDFRRIGEVEYWIVNNRTHNYCGKFLFLFEGQRCPLHYHKMKHETFFIAQGTVEMEADGRVFTMQQGETFAMEPGVNHTFAAVGGPALVLEVSLPSIQGDNFFADRRIGTDGVL